VAVLQQRAGGLHLLWFQRLGFLPEWVKLRVSTGPSLQVVETIQNEKKRTIIIIIMEKTGHTTIFQAISSLLLH